MKLDSAVLEIFRDETAERLDRVVEVLLAAEAGAAAPDAIDSLFRDIHSIKGNAGMVGFDEAHRIAHAMEDVLEPARDRGVLATDSTEPLLRATDAIRRVVAGEEQVAGPIVEALAASAMPPGGEPAPASAPATPATAPGQGSFRVAAPKVDRLLNSVGETVLQHRRLEHSLSLRGAEAAATGAVDEEMAHGGRLLDDLQHAAIEMRMLPLASITGPFQRAARDLAHREGKDVELTISGADTQLDRTILDGISETIGHLLSNAVVHGLEAPDEREAAGKPAQGRIELRADQRGGMVAIEVADDGRGISAEVASEAERRGSLLAVIARPGFSTAERVSDAAGRGVGLDAVKAHVEELGGELEVQSAPGDGMTVTLTLPLTLALLRVLLVERDGRPFGLPLSAASDAQVVAERMSLGGRPTIQVRERAIPLADLAALLGATARPLPARSSAVVVSGAGSRVAIAYDRLLGEQELVVKALGPVLARVRGYLGAAILGDGRVALILDPAALVRREASTAPPSSPGTPARSAPAPRSPVVLVVDDQFTVRELQRSILEAAGYRVLTACNGREAMESLSGNGTVDLVISDIQMPEMDGFALLDAIRSGPAHSDLPVVIVSARAGEEDRRRGAEAGGDAYVVKQEFSQRGLLDTVERLVGS